MNLVDVTVIKVLIEPYEQKNGNWSTTVLTDCFGQEKEKVIVGSRSEVEKYKIGYKWLE